MDRTSTSASAAPHGPLRVRSPRPRGLRSRLRLRQGAEATRQNLRASAPLANYAAGLAVYGAGLFLALIVPYYGYALHEQARWALAGLFAVYAVAGFAFLFFAASKRAPPSIPLLVLQALARPIRSLRSPGDWSLREALPTAEQKVALRFLLLKLVFLPMMVNYLFGNLDATQRFLSGAFSGDPEALYLPLMAGLALVDVTMFVLSYSLDFTTLGNKVRSVEPTLLGWAAALVCYPPLASYAVAQVGWFANDGAVFTSPPARALGRILIVVFFTIYVGATLTLGFKSSNLTNRGIVSRGPYAIVRHPGYTSKVTAWWIMTLPVMSIPAFLSMACWTFVYALRALTEERHLSQDPEYRAYRERVRWRFIPGIL